MQNTHVTTTFVSLCWYMWILLATLYSWLSLNGTTRMLSSPSSSTTDQQGPNKVSHWFAQGLDARDSTHVLHVQHQWLCTPLDTWAYPVRNLWCVQADVKLVYSLPILYCDDTSGNVFKKWNKHNSILFILGRLPQEATLLVHIEHCLTSGNDETSGRCASVSSRSDND